MTQDAEAAAVLNEQFRNDALHALAKCTISCCDLHHQPLC